jgi:drug/metabolite transporter (DMT)-like permease
MFFSAIFLRTKYSSNQYLGAGIILAGIGVVLLPKYFPSLLGHDDSGMPAAPDNNSAFFNLLFLSSLIPLALSSIYKEFAFGEADIDVNYLQVRSPTLTSSIEYVLFDLISVRMTASHLIDSDMVDPPMIDWTHHSTPTCAIEFWLVD